MTEPQSDGQTYLFVVNYETDTERKRAEYLLDNQKEGDIQPLEGMSRLASGIDVDELYDELAAKVPEEQISTYEVDRIDTEATREQESIHEEFENVDPDRVTWAMDSILKKRKAVKQGPRNGTEIWGVYTKKGRAEISYQVRSNNESVELDVTIEGFGDAPGFLEEFIQDELQYMID
jgi:hypothetical protein